MLGLAYSLEGLFHEAALLLMVGALLAVGLPGLVTIGRALSALAWDRRCRLARMSGSGATCFGLYEREGDALAAAERLRAAENGWWIAAAPVEAWSPQGPAEPRSGRD